MTAIAESWNVKVERGPDCLFLKLDCPPEVNTDFSHLAEHIWSILDQHFTYRVVLELDHLPQLRSQLIGQLVMLHKRLAQQNGMLRLCGLSSTNQQALRSCRLEPRFPHYLNREEAVLASRPTQPR